MATVSIVLRTARTNDEGYAPLYAICRHGGSAARLSLKLRVKPGDWNARTKEARKSCLSRNAVNERVGEARLCGRKATTFLSSRKGEYTAKDLRRELRMRLFGGEGGDFVQYAESVLKEIKKRQSHSTWLNRRGSLSRIRSFALQDGGISFMTLNRKTVQRFVTWLEKDGLAYNTIKNHIGSLRIFLTEALKDGKLEKDPLRHYTFHTKAKKPAPRAWLRKEEILRLADLSPTRSGERLALDMFLFSYYTWGMRFSDVFDLKKDNVSRSQVNYTMRKTGKTVSLPLTKQAREIAQRYNEGPRSHLFPLAARQDINNEGEFERAKRSRNKFINRNTKRLAKKANIDKNVTFHVARHSAASQMYLATEDIYRVKRFLGHSSVTMTENYLRGMDGISLDELGEWQGIL